MAKKYTSLGQMAKAGDFVELTKKLKEYKEAGDKFFNDLTEKTSEKTWSELDKLLYLSFSYARKPEPVVEEQEEQEDSMLSGMMAALGAAMPKPAVVHDDFKVDERPFEYADGFIDFLKYALEIGANPNARMEGSITSFLKSCELNDPMAVSILLDNKTTPVDINYGDGKGNRALYYAVMANADQTIEYLVKDRGVDIDFKYILSDNKTVFHYACGHCKVKSLDTLMKLGANPTIKDEYENLPADTMPVFDADNEDCINYSTADGEVWDQNYEKVAAYTAEFVKLQATKTPAKKFKTSF
jgi:Ankyrin repeats (3 copies)